MNCTYFEKIVDLAAHDTKKGARIVAKVFYKILRKKGFSENQIIDIATNMLNCLINSLNGCEKKFENAKQNRRAAESEHTYGEHARTITRFRRRFDTHRHAQFSANA